MVLDIVHVHFDCVGSQNLGGWSVLHFRTRELLFVAGARETSCFGAPKSTFRDRCKESEMFDFEVQFSWQAQHFGHGGDR